VGCWNTTSRSAVDRWVSRQVCPVRPTGTDVQVRRHIHSQEKRGKVGARVPRGTTKRSSRREMNGTALMTIEVRTSSPRRVSRHVSTFTSLGILKLTANILISFARHHCHVRCLRLNVLHPTTCTLLVSSSIRSCTQVKSSASR
jgi:hypothetical protein